METNTYGLKEDIEAIDMVEYIWKKLGLDKIFSKKTKQKIFDISTNDFKPVDKLLEPLIGVYDFEKLVLPDWYKKFKTEYITFLSDNLKDEVVEDYMGNKELKETKKLIESVNQLNTITPKQLKEGKLPNGQKIIKYLKGIIEQCTEVADPLDDDWYRTYELNKTSTKDEKIVITNSIPSLLGMSSYYDNPSYSSCMSLFKDNNGTSYGLGIWGNILDTNSLLLYVTDGETRDYRGLDKYPHQKMTVRAMIRLITTDNFLICHNCGMHVKEEDTRCHMCNYDISNRKDKIEQPRRIGIVIDRIYPHGQYNYEIFKTVEQLCKKHKLDFFMFKNYNAVQNGGSLCVDVKLTDKSYLAKLKNDVDYLLKKEFDKDCSTCGNMKSVKMCSKCFPATKAICEVCPVSTQQTKVCMSCNYKNNCTQICDTCDKLPCKSVREISKKVYDDNAGGNSFRNCDYSGYYKYKTQYEVKLVKEVK